MVHRVKDQLTSKEFKTLTNRRTAVVAAAEAAALGVLMLAPWAAQQHSRLVFHYLSLGFRQHITTTSPRSSNNSPLEEAPLAAGAGAVEAEAVTSKASSSAKQWQRLPSCSINPVVLHQATSRTRLMVPPRQ